jgi:hypothetical protein
MEMFNPNWPSGICNLPATKVSQLSDSFCQGRLSRKNENRMVRFNSPELAPRPHDAVPLRANAFI